MTHLIFFAPLSFQVALPQNAAGSTGEGLAEELSSGERDCPASPARSGAQPCFEKGLLFKMLKAQ